MITVDTLVATRPCADWPRDKIERLLASPTIDASSWVAFASSCQARRWRAPTLHEVLLTACRHARRLHRSTVTIPWLQAVTRDRVASIRRRYPSAPAAVAAVLDRLEAWDGTAGAARKIRDAAYAACAAAYAAAYAAAAYAADAAAAAYAAYAAYAAACAAACAAAADAAADAYDAYADAYDAYDAAAAARWRYLLDLCQRIDAAEESL